MEVRPNPTAENSSIPHHRQAIAAPSNQPGPSTGLVDTASVSQRLQKELMSLMMSGGDLGVSAFPEGESIFTWIGTIEGGKETVYEGLSYKLSLRFPLDYPFKPPQVKFETMCFHPNVDQFGNICLDILQDKWSSAYDCRTILLSIQSLLGEPNPVKTLPSSFISRLSLTHMAALASRLASLSSSSSLSSPCFRKPRSLNPFPICSLHYSNQTSSPFTEKHSAERYQRDQWMYKNQSETCSLPLDSDSIRQNDIAEHLPELKKLLQVLKEKRESRNGGDGGEKSGPGNVYLVGTGPGDPELLTLKAARVIQNADLLLYDRLVSNDVLGMVGAHARLLYVGKTAGYHSRTQEEIHELLLSFAEAGANIVRLKGGDPLVFGRGGEEMDFLQQLGIQVKVIPGITAASGIAAELGIPLTHRGVATSVRFLTGHSRKGGTDPLFVAENAADPDTTLVVYMGLSTLPSLAQKLMDHGLPPDTPAAAIERGTTPQQRTVFAELGDLAREISSAELISPTLVIIGKVVALSPFWPHSCREEEYCLTEA